MRVAIVHYWLVGMRGGEKVLEALCDLYPDAVIFTHVFNPDAISEKIKRHKIHSAASVLTLEVSELPATDAACAGANGSARL